MLSTSQSTRSDQTLKLNVSEGATSKRSIERSSDGSASLGEVESVAFVAVVHLWKGRQARAIGER